MDNTQAYSPDTPGGYAAAAAAWRPHGPGFVSREDTHLRLTVWNSAAGVTVTLAGQIARADGRIVPFVYTLIPTNARAASPAIFPLEEGVILCAEAFASAGTPQRGQCFVRLELMQGKETSAISLGTIFQQYVTASIAAAYPGSEIDQPDEGPGFIHTFVGTNPAAGVELSDTVPTGARWRLLAGEWNLSTSVNAGSRVPRITLDDGVNVFFRGGVFSGIGPNGNLNIDFGEARGLQSNVGGDDSISLPRKTVLLAGWRIRSTTLALDALDDYTSPVYLIEEWIDI